MTPNDPILAPWDAEIMRLNDLVRALDADLARLAARALELEADMAIYKERADRAEAECHEAWRRTRNAEETNRVNESCLRNTMAEADALREDKARLDWLAYDMESSPLF